MGKGDSARSQKIIDIQGPQNQQNINNDRTNFQNQNTEANRRYNNAADRSVSDYDQLMKGFQNFINQNNVNNPDSSASYFKNFASGGRDSQIDPAGRDAALKAIGTYGGFADNGGYRPGDIENIRARSFAPIRSSYESAQQNIDRSQRIANGSSPNYIAATSKLSRDQSNSLGEANVNLEAQLADAIRQGKLAGASGLASTGQGQEQAMAAIDAMNNSNRLAGAGGLQNSQGMNLDALRSMTSAYGTTPGQANMYGNQLSNSNRDLSTSSSQMLELFQKWLSGQINKSQVPGNYDVALGRVGNTASVAGKVMTLGTLAR